MAEVPRDPEELRKLTDQILRSVTSQQFLDQVQAVEDAPTDQKLVAASARLTPDTLRRAGVDLPEGVRVSSRYFEEGLGVPVELADGKAGENIVNALNRVRPGFS